MSEKTLPAAASSAEQNVAAQASRPTRRWSTLLIWAGILSLLALLGWGLLRANAGRPEPGNAAPSFEMQYFEGYEWNDLSASTLQDMEGKVVVLNFWASWCVECRLEADLLENAWRQYRDQDVVFLGVAWVDSERKSLAYLEEFGITYPNAPDLGSAIAGKYEITGVPETFFIDRNGNVAHFVIGPVSSDVLHGQIRQLLAQ